MNNGSSTGKAWGIQQRKEKLLFSKMPQTGNRAFFNPFSPSCLFTDLLGAPSASKVGAVRRKDVVYYRLYVREQYHSKLITDTR